MSAPDMIEADNKYDFIKEILEKDLVISFKYADPEP